MRNLLCGLLLLLPAVRGSADRLTFDSAAEWTLWKKPAGVTRVDDAGQLQLVRFRKEIDVVDDAHLFRHQVKSNSEKVPGGIGAPAPGRKRPGVPSMATRRPSGSRIRPLPAKTGPSSSTWVARCWLGRSA